MADILKDWPEASEILNAGTILCAVIWTAAIVWCVIYATKGGRR